MKTPDAELSTAETIMVSLLAATDSVWLPSRESHGGQINPVVTNVFELRSQFRESGVPWASRGTNNAEQKTMQRALEDLTRDGSVTVARPLGTKTLAVRMTDAAYDRARRQCGEPGFSTAYLMLRLVAHFSVRPAQVMQDIWIPETKFNGGRGWGDANQNQLFFVSQRALPALVAGWLETNCDNERHVYFRVTKTGWQLIDAGSKPADVPAVKRDSRFALAYYERLRVEQARLFARTPDDAGELGFLRLPVSHHDVPVLRKPT